MVYCDTEQTKMQKYRTLGNFIETITFADTATGGGQIYPKRMLIDAFDIYMSKDKYYRGGGIDSPAGIIDDNNLSHFLVDWWFKGNEMRGEIEVVDTTMGKAFMNLKDSGAVMTLGLAAMGTFKSNYAQSRNLFDDYTNMEEYSKELATVVVHSVYVLLKSNTNH